MSFFKVAQKSHHSVVFLLLTRGKECSSSALLFVYSRQCRYFVFVFFLSWFVFFFKGGMDPQQYTGSMAVTARQSQLSIYRARRAQHSSHSTAATVQQARCIKHSKPTVQQQAGSTPASRQYNNKSTVQP